MKRRIERLSCEACGHAFTWTAWRKGYQGKGLLTGKPAPIQRYVDQWPAARTTFEQLLAIDTLVNAIHGRGAMGPMFIEGSEDRVMALLNRLADE